MRRGAVAALFRGAAKARIPDVVQGAGIAPVSCDGAVGALGHHHGPLSFPAPFYRASQQLEQQPAL